MVNRPKYDDFVQVGSTTKRFHDTDVSFVQFSCPMDGCNELVNVRDDEVERRKSTRCLEHLKKCKSFAAATDPRVCGKRKAPEPAAAPPPAPAPPDTSAASTALSPREEKLQLRNDRLQQELCAQKAEIDDLHAGMAEMRRFKADTEASLTTLAQKLGMTTPPLPALSVCIEKIEGMQKSAALGSIVGGSSAPAEHPSDAAFWKAQVQNETSELRRRNEELVRRTMEEGHRLKRERREVEQEKHRLEHDRKEVDEERERLRRKYREYDLLQELVEGSRTTENRERAEGVCKIIAKGMVAMHPDKNGDLREDAERVSKVLLSVRSKLTKHHRF